MAERNTKIREGRLFADPVKGGVRIEAGKLTALDANGYLIPATTGVGLVCRGRARQTVDATAEADGARTCESEAGVLHYKNDGTITRAHIGDLAYIVNDETVSQSDGAGTRSTAGKIVDLDTEGVWIYVAGF